MTAEHIPLPTLAATEALAHQIAPQLRPGDALLLEGPLGAGKTAFARALLRTLANDPALDVPSPSYTLLQSYETPHFTVHHYDLWRLTGPDSLHELGWDDAQRDVIIVEWPERLGPATPARAWRITLELSDGEQRVAVVSSP